MFFKSTPRRPRRHGRAGALDRDAAAGHLRGNGMPGLQLLVQRLVRKRLARDRDARTRNSATADKPRDAFVQYAMAWLTP